MSLDNLNPEFNQNLPKIHDAFDKAKEVFAESLDQAKEDLDNQLKDTSAEKFIKINYDIPSLKKELTEDIVTFREWKIVDERIIAEKEAALGALLEDYSVTAEPAKDTNKEDLQTEYTPKYSFAKTSGSLMNLLDNLIDSFKNVLNNAKTYMSNIFSEATANKSSKFCS